MLARTRLLVLVFVAAAAGPTVAQSQSAPDLRSTSQAGPRREFTATAARSQSQQHASLADVMQRRRSQGMGQPVALMIVGGAAVVLGALIGDDVGTVFMIGGAVALLIGLYQYMQ
jgi:hypothetical protein